MGSPKADVFAKCAEFPVVNGGRGHPTLRVVAPEGRGVCYAVSSLGAAGAARS